MMDMWRFFTFHVTVLFLRGVGAYRLPRTQHMWPTVNMVSNYRKKIQIFLLIIRAII